jgi:hypothetical protein
MKKIIIIIGLNLVSCLLFAQDTYTKKTFFMVQATVLKGSAIGYENTGLRSGTVGETVRLGVQYGFHASDKFDLSAGLQAHLIPRIRYYDNREEVILLPLTIDAHYKFKAQPKTTFFFANYGIAPKLGGSFYAGTQFGLGLGWQYQPEFLNENTLSLALGYNLTRIKNVLTSRTTSSSIGGDITTFHYYTHRLSTLALTIGVSF